MPQVKQWTLTELEDEARAFMRSVRWPQTVNGFISWLTPRGG